MKRFQEFTFNKKPGSGPHLIHTTGIFTFIIRSAHLDDQSACLAFFFHVISVRHRYLTILTKLYRTPACYVLPLLVKSVIM